MQPGLFRKKALDRLSSPDRLDQLMRVTSPRSWLVLVAVAAIIVAGVLWAFAAQVPRTVSGQAILAHEGGLTNAVAPTRGVIQSIDVQPGDLVEKGDVIAHLQATSDFGISSSNQSGATPATAQLIEIRSPRKGRVVELLADSSDLVDIGDSIISIEGVDEAIVAYVYVPIGPGKLIQNGMQVQLTPSTVEEAQYGHLLGRVVSVSEFPVTERGLTSLLDNDVLAKDFLSDGPVLQVAVELEKDPGTVSGYKWSSPKGPPFDLSHGTIADGTIVLDEQSPVAFVLPGF